jgi:phosphonate transport system substrate-binding protein
MPDYYIRKHLGSPDEVFSRVGFSGDHSQPVAMVQSGAYQARAVNYQVWDQEAADGQIDKRQWLRSSRQLGSRRSV